MIPTRNFSFGIMMPEFSFMVPLILSEKEVASGIKML
jgi:hypothetical protein